VHSEGPVDAAGEPISECATVIRDDQSKGNMAELVMAVDSRQDFENSLLFSNLERHGRIRCQIFSSFFASAGPRALN
jgi:hypothetical protein